MEIQHDLTFGSYTHRGTLDEPTLCPLCKHKIKPETLHITSYSDESGHKFAAALFLCRNCFCVFTSLYSLSLFQRSPGSKHEYTSTLRYTGPQEYEKREFDKAISALSPLFVKIFNQAAAADSYGLDEIAGIGYRKAVEFLVKDYCTHLHPDKEEEIKGKLLSRCINDYIDNIQIKTLAERAVWIGNDETHYIRKQEDRDVQDMKNFIQAMVYFVGMALIAEDASSMSPA